MDTIDVKRPVMIKVIMTEGFRKQLIDEAKATIERIDANLNTIEEEGKKQIEALEESESEKAASMKSQIELDRDRLFQMKSELQWKIKEVENIEEGAELPFRIVEGSINIKVGDDVLEKMSKTEIVVKDWKVVEIRNA